jgi:hypothetical protein
LRENFFGSQGSTFGIRNSIIQQKKRRTNQPAIVLVHANFADILVEQIRQCNQADARRNRTVIAMRHKGLAKANDACQIQLFSINFENGVISREACIANPGTQKLVRLKLQLACRWKQILVEPNHPQKPDCWIHDRQTISFRHSGCKSFRQLLHFKRANRAAN